MSLNRYTDESARTTGPSKHETYKGWFDVEPTEFCRLLALLMSLYNSLWAWAFMEKKIQLLMSSLTVSHRDREDKENKLVKVGCQNLFQLGRNLAKDERMVRNKSRYSFRQYIRDKPTKCGMKLWVVADPETGYTYNLDV